ncbi:hypothetical protein Aazo_2736 ['Nostoc azollae' 0708]|uniref:Uncharacterized protein n=1 Tax=Nostoc azollae (strain 0708) TaxID=551115 RepID=D7DZX2_NOSA0|nr:hypothetical protein Aazo_2736 ['Nostoc azollae' 0708]
MAGCCLEIASCIFALFYKDSKFAIVLVQTEVWVMVLME